MEAPDRGGGARVHDPQTDRALRRVERNGESIKRHRQTFSDPLYISLLGGPAKKERLFSATWRKTAKSGGFFLREEPVREVIQIRLFADSLDVDTDLYAGEREDRNGI